MTREADDHPRWLPNPGELYLNPEGCTVLVTRIEKETDLFGTATHRISYVGPEGCGDCTFDRHSYLHWRFISGRGNT